MIIIIVINIINIIITSPYSICTYRFQTQCNLGRLPLSFISYNPSEKTLHWIKQAFYRMHEQGSVAQGNVLKNCWSDVKTNSISTWCVSLL